MPTLNDIVHITKAGLMTRLKGLDVVSNNLANINTIGYKASRMNFQELFDQIHNGVKTQSTQISLEAGKLETTDNPLDMAILGEGYFAVTLPDGKLAYTRNGQFTLDADNQLITADGYKLVWQGQIPEGATNIQVKSNGTILGMVGDKQVELGKIQVYCFQAPSALTGYGENCWLETEASGKAQAGVPGEEHNGEILGSTLESSNVDLGTEFSNMIILERSYQMAARAFTQTDTMISQAINMRR